MDIGKAATDLVVALKDRASQQKQSAISKRPPPNGPPNPDRLCDIELPRLVCWKPEGHGEHEIVRTLTAEEIGRLQARENEIANAIAPFAPEQAETVQGTISAMLSGFRFMRQQGEDADSVVEITMAVLREYPAWAIEEACLKIARGLVGLDPRFAPNDTEIAGVVAGVVSPHKFHLDSVRGLLGARVRETEKSPRPTKAEIEAKLGRPLPKQPRPESAFERRERMQRIADDLALRKARNESIASSPSGEHAQSGHYAPIPPIKDRWLT